MELRSLRMGCFYSESGVHPNTIVQVHRKTPGAFASAKIPSGAEVRNMGGDSMGRVYIACIGVDKVVW